MKRPIAVGLLTLVVASAAASMTCSGVKQTATEPNVAAAEAMVDAFYSFDSTRLRTALASAEASISGIVFYQGWAEGGNYEVVNRMPCRKDSRDEVTCAITVKDDLVAALGIPFDVTDSFHVSFSDGKISNVRTTSNDPQVFRDAIEWVRRERPNLVGEPCRGFFNGGPTPGKCAQAMVRGFAEFPDRRR